MAMHNSRAQPVGYHGEDALSAVLVHLLDQVGYVRGVEQAQEIIQFLVRASSDQDLEVVHLLLFYRSFHG